MTTDYLLKKSLPLFSISYIISLFVILSYFNNTFDFTDDSFYWLFAKYASDYTLGVSQFGHYASLVYSLAFKDIFFSRILGATLLLSSSFYLAYQLEYLLNKQQKVNLHVALLITSFFVLFYYGKFFLLGVSYNWLALLGVIIFIGGILSLINKSSTGSNSLLLPTIFYLSLGGWLSWNAKAPIAVGLFFIYILFMLICYNIISHSNKIKTTKHVIFFVLILLASHILFFENNFYSYLNKYLLGLEAKHILAGHSTPIIDKLSILWSSILNFILPTFNNSISIFFIFLTITLKIFFWISVRIKKHSWKKHLALAITITSVLAFVPYGKTLYLSELSLTLIYVYSSVLFISIINIDCEIISYQQQQNPVFLRNKFFLISLSLILLLLPLIMTLGTGNSYQKHMILFSGFFFLAIYALLKSNLFFKNAPSIIFLLIGFFVGIFSIYQSMLHPYRMPESVFTKTYRTTFFTDNNHLNLNLKAHQYITALQKIALNNGWQKGNLLIDLTGGTPGAALALGAFPPGKPWLLGGYKGSMEFSEFVLSHQPGVNLKSAWLLTSPNGKRKINPTLLNNLSLSFPQNFVKVGELNFEYHRKEIHYLWKPKN